METKREKTKQNKEIGNGRTTFNLRLRMNTDDILPSVKGLIMRDLNVPEIHEQGEDIVIKLGNKQAFKIHVTVEEILPWCMEEIVTEFNRISEIKKAARRKPKP